MSRDKCCQKTVLAHCEGCPHIPVERCPCFRCKAASEPAPASAPSELRDLALGDTYLEAGADLHTSGINVGKHGNRIQCYGRKPEDAEALRDEVWRALTAPASAPSCCGALEEAAKIADERGYELRAYAHRASDKVSMGREAVAMAECWWVGHLIRAMAAGCCSAISPCAHQRQDPTTSCDTCKTGDRHE